jgi:hypothetical protein
MIANLKIVEAEIYRFVQSQTEYILRHPKSQANDNEQHTRLLHSHKCQMLWCVLAATL